MSKKNEIGCRFKWILKLTAVTDYSMEELIAMSAIEIRDLVDEYFPLVFTSKSVTSSGGVHVEATVLKKAA